ncbi:kinase-like domain-containing protein [Spinellus fusiger]|nr:kinase-like domain-containing protein [Spinellus fusiger]
MGATCCKHEQVIEAGVTLHHFRLLRTIGKGALGKVLLVQHKQTKHYFALKAINKTQCIRRKAVNHVIAERFLLEDIHHTLLVKMHYAFQDEEHFFLVLDVMAGGDLRFQLTQTGPLSELQVRFYMAEIALGLASLHQQRIAHRDIKPENILLDAEGHVHLSDLNTATRFDRHHPLQWSMAGSPAYMAPEMIAKKGYSTSVDWWSLGVLAYELLFGKRPFDCGSNEALLESIVHQPLEFPQHAYEMCSKECLDVITKLLDKSPFHRLGCGLDNFEQFKVHHWFDGIDWTALENKQCKPPYQPEKTFCG